MNYDVRSQCRIILFAILILFGLAAGAQATDGTWVNVNGGSWNTSSNWLNGIIADGAGSTANLTADLGSDQTVTLDGSRTLKKLAIGDTDNTSKYNLSTGTLTFDNSGGIVYLTQNAGSAGDTLSCDVEMNGNLTVVNNSTTSNALTISGDVMLNQSVEISGPTKQFVISGSISDGEATYSLTKTGTGWLWLFGTNSYAGGTILDNAKLVINSDRSLGAVPASPEVNLATALNKWYWLMAVEDVTLDANRNIQLNEKGGFAAKEGKTLTINGQISGYGPTLNMNGFPDSVFAEYPDIIWHGDFVFAPGNTYIEHPTVDQKTVVCYGKLSISADSCLGAVPAAYYYRDIILANGDYGSPVYNAILCATETFSLNANRGVALFDAKNAIEVAADKTFTILGPLVTEPDRDMAGLSKLGDGTLALNAAAIDACYTGNTTVVEGTLLVNGSLSTNPAAAAVVTVKSGATLGGTGSIYSPVTVEAGGTLAPGASAGTLTVNNDVTLDSGATLSVETGTSSDQLDLATAGAISLAGADLSVIDTEAITIGTVIPIVTNATSVTGEFDGLTDGATLDSIYNTYQIEYGTTYVNLEVTANLSYITAGSTNTLVGIVGGNYTFNIGIVSGALCHVEASTNLLEHPAGWVDISGPLVSTGTVTFTDTDTALYPERMYRVVSP